MLKMAKKEQYTELLSAELLSFSNKNTSHSVSSSKYSHVKIQKIDKERHRIVVVNESIEVSHFVVYRTHISYHIRMVRTYHTRTVRTILGFPMKIG